MITICIGPLLELVLVLHYQFPCLVLYQFQPFLILIILIHSLVGPFWLLVGIVITINTPFVILVYHIIQSIILTLIFILVGLIPHIHILNHLCLLTLIVKVVVQVEVVLLDIITSLDNKIDINRYNID